MALALLALLFGLVFASPAQSQHFQIRDNPQGGDCVGRQIGAWNPASKTCTLTASLTGSISIEDDAVTLDGGGLQLRRGPGTQADGVTVQNRKNVFVRRILVHGFDQGIVIKGGRSNVVEESAVTGPGVTRHGILLEATFDSHARNNNRVSSATDIGIWVRWSRQCTVTKNILSLNHIGTALTDANHNKLQKNQITGSRAPLGIGVQFLGGNNNEVSGNTIRRSSLAGITIGRANGDGDRDRRMRSKTDAARRHLPLFGGRGWKAHRVADIGLDGREKGAVGS